MLTMPSFKKSLIVEQFQGNYLKQKRRFLSFPLAFSLEIFDRQDCAKFSVETKLLTFANREIANPRKKLPGFGFCDMSQSKTLQNLSR